MAVVLVAVVLVVVGVRTLTGNDSDDSDVASATFTESPAGEDSSDAPATVTTVTVAPEEQAEETTTPTALPLPEPSPVPSPEDATSGSGPLACDGRGVLIVSTVRTDTGLFQQEMENSRARWPDAVIMPPGSCPSVRGNSGGADNYAVVIDYGDDLAALCAAERNGGGNARLLNSDTSYNSPC